MSIVEDLEHIRVIGEGAFSIVREYRSGKFGGSLAVKQLKDSHAGNPDYIKRFRREVELLRALSGTPHVVELIDSEVDGPVFRYAMPCARMNLADLLRARNNQLGFADRLALFQQVLAGMRAAHAKQILHRDLAPSNVLVLDAGASLQVAVADFGLGKSLADIESATRSSVASLGQLNYVAPEQREILKSASARSDVYSVGKILNYILTGREPHVVHPCEFNTVCRRACAPDPADRYGDLGELEEEYLLCRDLQLRPPTPSDEWTTRERLASGEQLGWQEFLGMVIEGKTDDHIYYDVIEPTIQYLQKDDNLQQFVAALGPSESDFVEALQKHMHDCYRTVGWPFSSMNWFGDFLFALFHRLHTHRARLICLEELWSLAYENDQWSVQRKLYGLINDGNIPQDLAIDFAMAIAKSDVNSQKPQLSRRNVHPAIQNAIDSLVWGS